MSSEERMRIVAEQMAAGVELIGRSGAKALEVGYLHDDVPAEEAAWWASVQFQGAKVMVENQLSAPHAIDALLSKLLDGAQCRWCGRIVTNRKSKSAVRFCRYELVDGQYIRGCAETHQETTVPVPSWLR